MTDPATPPINIGDIAEKAADELSSTDLERLAAALLRVICMRTAERHITRDTHEYHIDYADRTF